MKIEPYQLKGEHYDLFVEPTRPTWFPISTPCDIDDPYYIIGKMKVQGTIGKYGHIHFNFFRYNGGLFNGLRAAGVRGDIHEDHHIIHSIAGKLKQEIEETGNRRFNKFKPGIFYSGRVTQYTHREWAPYSIDSKFYGLPINPSEEILRQALLANVGPLDIDQNKQPTAEEIAEFTEAGLDFLTIALAAHHLDLGNQDKAREYLGRFETAAVK